MMLWKPRAWVLGATLLGVACQPTSSTDGDTVTDAGARDAGPWADAAPPPDASAVDPDAAVAVPDAGAAGDGGSGTPCDFNSDCPAAERCECNGGLCGCQTGARGSGRNGVDTCSGGNDCASSVCLDGPADVLYCSGPCPADGGCPDLLPVCMNVGFSQPICVRSSGS